MNILIAESGSSKTDWRFLNDENQLSFQTIGFNPYHISEQTILDELNNSKLKDIKEKVDVLFFYGAGCSSTEKKNEIQSALQLFFTQCKIKVEHDLLAAARAACGKEKGMVAILGTGSNSCLYNGEEIIANIPALGYILGDEGSGSYMGKKLIQMYLYGDLEKELNDAFESNYEYRMASILDAVYKKELPNRFLAQFTRFIKQKEAYPQMNLLIENAFVDFFENHIIRYDDYKKVPLNIVGSIGNVFQTQLNSVAQKYEVKIGKVIKQPIEELVDFHTIF